MSPTTYTNLIKTLGFTPKENASDIFHKKYTKDYFIEIDFENERINYGKLADKEITQNFSQDENWVVLECVDRLLEKGYSPKNIALEKVYPSGHGTSGRLDILVNREDGTAYLMIECKTYGFEFEKAVKKLKKDGGQIFTYFQQDKNADILMLYASELQGNEIIYKNEIIKIEEDYRQTGNVKDFFDRWNKLPKNNGVFDDWVNPYDFQSKALTPNSLVEIKQADSSFIFNQFLEILRHNVVSDKPNAFNKIFTLFLCKIYDEKATKPNEELGFQWLEGKDNHISFQKRLTDLYKKGMKEFLEKDVTDLSDSEFEKKFHGVDEPVKQQLLDEFTKIRLKKNNEFAIKEVFDDDSFEENAKVVKEVVELLQGFKIRYTKKQQYLSDFFEMLLTTGLKQESGQFFTPVPIAQFIIKSIPIDKIVHEKLAIGDTTNLLPTIIDYAAGSGHFITESMHEVQRIIDNTDSTEFVKDIRDELESWKIKHFNWAFQYIYGIEKDYRLVKVGKVGCYLHGDGLAKIIHSDGLGNFTKTEEYKDLLKKADKNFPQENKQFDICVSNPPYSVSAFKNNARRYYTEEDFEIYDKLTDQSSEIECLFIERTKQLLKDGGIAGIILPSTILNNTGLYTKAREIILQYFDIIAIARLDANTFMATDTKTVTLFLRRRNNYDAINIRKSVEKAVADVKDVTINGIEKPFSKYVARVWEGISFGDYSTLLKKQPNEAIKNHEIYQEYEKKINVKEDSEKWNKIIEIETEKLFYFILAYKQKVVLVKSGEKQEEKQFLGYEFSDRRGSEGIHPIQRRKTIDECTQLFDADIFDNPEKASTYIYQAFNGDFETPISEKLAKNVSRVDLVDMFTLDRAEFEKTISLAEKKKIKIESKWDLVRLGTAVEYVQGLVYGKDDESGVATSKRILTASNIILESKSLDSADTRYLIEEKEIDEKYLIKKRDIFLCTSSGSRSHLGKSTLIKKDLENHYFGGFCAVLRETKKIDIALAYQYLQTQEYRNYIEGDGGQNINNLRKDYLLDFKIPLPPKDVQEKIVAEITLLEAKKTKAETKIENYRKEIFAFFNKVSATGKVLDLCKVSTERLNPQGFLDKLFVNLGLENIESNSGKVISKPIELGSQILSTKNVFGKGNILYGKLRPYLNKVALVDFDGICSTDILVLKTDVPVLLKYTLLSESFVSQTSELMAGASLPRIKPDEFLNVKIPLPSHKEQQTIVMQITELETKIAVLENEVSEILQQQEAVLREYL
jgi:type I restriction enzyme M protein